MPFFDLLRTRLREPATAAAIAAVALRLLLLSAAWTANPMVAHPQLDGDVYLQWSAEIAAGDLLGTDPAGLLRGGPLFLNPLYAYLLVPFQLIFEAPVLPILVAQALLGGGTAALAATTAGRLFGRPGAWIAGLAVAFSAVLTQLDLHLSVSGLAAFLVAGAAWSCVPPSSSGRWRLVHSPIATGLWLGLGALARPVTLFALPFLLWLHVRRGEGRTARIRAAGGLLVAFGLCVGPSLARNWIVTGEPILFTAASGANLHLGNNPDSRRFRTMATPHFRFNPREMHDDARRYMSLRLGPDASWGEISARFTNDAIEEIWRQPGDSIAFYARKVRWFVSPTEVPSSASFEMDRELVPWLRLAFLPTWLLMAAGLVGLWAHRKRPDVLLGVGSLGLAHVLVLTMVFPLSHYRSPSVPAFAILAAGLVHWVLAERRRPRLLAAGIGIAALGVLGVVPPGPGPLRHTGLMNLSLTYGSLDRWDKADELAQRATTVYDAEWAPLELAAPWFQRGMSAYARGRPADAVPLWRRGLEIQPQNWEERLHVCVSLLSLARPREALAEAQRCIEIDARLRGHPAVRSRIGECMVRLGEHRQARPHLEFGLRVGRFPRDRPADWAVDPFPDLRGDRRQ